jgi:hypothetical protein
VKAGVRTLAGGTRRLLALAAGISVATALVSLTLGALFQASVHRSLSVGFYVIGSALIAIGCVHGLRGPIRFSDSSRPFAFERSAIRWASREEQEESLASSALFVVLGFTLLLIGVLTDALDPGAIGQ